MLCDHLDICRSCFATLSDQFERREVRFDMHHVCYDATNSPPEERDPCYALKRIVKPTWLDERGWNLSCAHLTCDKADKKRVERMVGMRHSGRHIGHAVVTLARLRKVLEEVASARLEYDAYDCPYYMEHRVMQYNEGDAEKV